MKVARPGGIDLEFIALMAGFAFASTRAAAWLLPV